MKIFLKILFLCFTVSTSLQLRAFSRHLILHNNTFFQQQQPAKNHKENAKLHANSNSIISNSNVKKNGAKKDQPKNADLKNNEKVNKKKK